MAHVSIGQQGEGGGPWAPGMEGNEPMSAPVPDAKTGPVRWRSRL